MSITCLKRDSYHSNLMAAMMADLAMLPGSLHKLIFMYQLEIPIETLFWRMQISPGGDAGDIVSFGFKYDKIAQIFEDLLEMSKKFEMEAQVRGYIRQIAQTRYHYSESAVGIRPWSYTRLDNQMAYWEIQLPQAVACEKMIEGMPLSRVEELENLFKTLEVEKEAPGQLVQLTRKDLEPVPEPSLCARIFSCVPFKSCFSCWWK